MTQPNDTQAPDRIWADQASLTWVEEDPTETMRQWEVVYTRADLAAAQTAAAWMAGRDAAVADVRESWDEGVPPAEFAEWAEKVEPPADLSAALDALIAERVREAVETEREACAKVADDEAQECDDLYNDLHGRRIAWRVSGLIRTRASKEGR